MRLLKLSVSGLSIFEGPLTLDFYASNRVMTGDFGVRHVPKTADSVYSQTVLALAGLNATGKTTVLRVIELAVNLVTAQVPLGTMTILPLTTLFPRGGITMRVIYQRDNGHIYLLESRLVSKTRPNVSASAWPGADQAIAVQTEKLWERPAGKMPKRLLEDFETFKGTCARAHVRQDLQPVVLSALGSARSIATLDFDNKGNGSFEAPAAFPVIESNLGGIQPIADARAQVTHVFDRSVDGVDVGDDGMAVVHFAGEAEDRTTSAFSLAALLSVGTVRGLQIVQNAIGALRCGGYLLVDEIENSLNKKLVETIIDLFQSAATNPHNAVLVFTTHYPELLDYLDRTDSIYFTRRDVGSGQGATVAKLADLEPRDDLSASALFMANKYGGTAPKAHDLDAFRQYVSSLVQGDDER